METSARKIDLFEVAEIKLTYLNPVKPSERPKVDCYRQVYEVFCSFWEEDSLEFVEHFNLMLLNRANRVLGIMNISSGGTAGTVVDVKLIMATALKANASSIILSHNHPSGNLRPSEQDIRLTSRVKDAGRILDVPVLDHIIISSEGYYSFADEGAL